ncbi:MAG: hypothetical protein ACXWVM_17565 [Polyangiales bacterium]
MEPATVPPVEAPPAPVAKPKNIVIGHGTKVLVVGDSMVRSGLGLRIAELVRARGGVYLEDYSTKNEGDRLEKLVIALKPDVTFVVVGSTDAEGVKEIASKVSAKPCVFVGPPKRTGVVEIERDNSAPCEFFDSSNLKLDRKWSGHPSTTGGAQWGTAVWDAMVAPES